MTAALKNIAETVEQLPAKDRVFLAGRLLAGLEEADLEKQWAGAAIRRRNDVRSGKVKPVPVAEVCRRMERLLDYKHPSYTGKTTVMVVPWPTRDLI